MYGLSISKANFYHIILLKNSDRFRNIALHRQLINDLTQRLLDLFCLPLSHFHFDFFFWPRVCQLTRNPNPEFVHRSFWCWIVDIFNNSNVITKEVHIFQTYLPKIEDRSWFILASPTFVLLFEWIVITESLLH